MKLLIKNNDCGGRGAVGGLRLEEKKGIIPGVKIVNFVRHCVQKVPLNVDVNDENYVTNLEKLSVMPARASGALALSNSFLTSGLLT